MLKISGRVKYTKALKRDIKALRPLTGDEWDKIKGKVKRKYIHQGHYKIIIEAKSKIVKRLKNSIREQLMQLQNNQCGYCGNKLGITADGQIEHILPKKGGVTLSGHPQHTFAVYNLILACPKCNMVLKRVTDPIKVPHINYKYCEFFIVHPYLDDFRHHLGEAVEGGTKIIITAKSFKGMRSMILFDLNHEDKCIQRAAKVLYEKRIASGDISDELNEGIIERTINYKQGY